MLLLLLGSGDGWAATTDLYGTSFEPPTFDEGFTLEGQGDWLVSGTGGNGLFLDGVFQGQSAYVGLFPPLNSNVETTVWYPLNFLPLQQGMPIVKFSVDFVIWDSTTNHPFADEFRWAVVNTEGRPLCQLVFDAFDFRVFTLLNDGSPAVDTGRTFQTNTAHTLSLRLDYLANRWSAVLSNHLSRSTVLLATNLPLNATNAVSDLGDIDATWIVYDLQNPGDNLMEFDRYLVTAEGPGPFHWSVLPSANENPPRYRLAGESGQRFVVEASERLTATGTATAWIPVQTNTIANGSFDFVDLETAQRPARFYRARWSP